MEPTNDEQRRSYGFTCIFYNSYYYYYFVLLIFVLTWEDKQLWTNFHSLFFAINGTHSKSPSLFVLGSTPPSPMVQASSSLASVSPISLLAPSTPTSQPSTPTSAPSTPTLPLSVSLSPSAAEQEIAVLEQSVLSKLHTYPLNYLYYTVYYTYIFFPKL